MSFAALTIDVNAKLAGLETGLKRVEDMTSRTARHIEGLNSVVSTLTAGFAALGGALTVGALAGQVRAVADLQDRMGKLAQQTGIGVSALSELDYAARLSDVSTDELSAGITRLTAKMGDVAQGSKEAAAIFDSLGVQVRGSDGALRSAEDVLKDIAERFSEFADGSTKTAYAVELFGRSGAKLIPLLNSGRDGLAEMAGEARQLGVVFDEQATKAAERFNDNLTRLEKSAEGLKVQLLQGLIPPLADLTQRFLDARTAGISFIDALDIAANIKGFGTLDEKIADVRRRLEGAKSGQWTGLFSNDVKGLQAELENLEKLKQRVLGREMSGYETTIDYSAFGRPPAAPPRLPGPTKPAGAVRFQQAELTDEQRTLIAAVGLYADVEKRASDYAATLEWLDKLYFDNAISAQQYDVAVQQITKSTERLGDDGVGALQRQADAWLDQLDPMREFTRQLEQVERALQFGLLSDDQAEAIKKRMADALQPVSEADAWAVQAAKNIQDALGENLYQMLDGNFENIGKSFGNMLKRMAAEAMAANLGRTLFGDFAKTGNVGGVAGSILSWAGGLFGIPSHADGLERVPYDGYVARLHKDERVQTAAEARADRRKSLTISQSFVFQGNASRQEGLALARSVKQQTIAALREANWRNDVAVTG